MKPELESLANELISHAIVERDIDTFKQKLTNEVLFYKSSHGYLLNRIVGAFGLPAFVEAILEFLPSYEYRMQLINGQRSNHQSAFKMSIYNHQTKIIKVFFAYGVKPYLSKFDILRYVALYCNDEMLFLFLRNGAKFNKKLNSWTTPQFNSAFQKIQRIKSFEALISPLFVSRLRDKNKAYIPKDLLRNLLKFLL